MNFRDFRLTESWVSPPTFRRQLPRLLLVWFSWCPRNLTAIKDVILGKCWPQLCSFFCNSMDGFISITSSHWFRGARVIVVKELVLLSARRYIKLQANNPLSNLSKIAIAIILDRFWDVTGEAHLHPDEQLDFLQGLSASYQLGRFFGIKRFRDIIKGGVPQSPQSLLQGTELIILLTTFPAHQLVLLSSPRETTPSSVGNCRSLQMRLWHGLINGVFI